MRWISGKPTVETVLALFLIFSGASIGAASHDDGPPSRLNADVKSPFAVVAREVGDSVVFISGVHETERTSSPYHFKEKSKFPGAGSGFVFGKDGRRVYILTNHHVIGTAKTIEVTLADQTQWMADVVGGDAETDLAVLSIETDRPVKMARIGDSDAVDVGDWAIAIGNPLPVMKDGDLLNVHQQSVTVGIVSAKHRSQLDFGENVEGPVYQDYLQTDAPINGGNSGGPLFNVHGEVIGVNAAIFSPVHLNIGIGFAIPSNLARRVADDLIRHGRVVRAYVGFSPQAITDDLRRALGLKSLAGVLVARVSEDTPAGKAGLRKGDIVVGYGGKSMENLNAFRMAVANSVVGRPVSLEIVRDGETLTLQVVPTEYPRRELVKAVSIPQSAHWLGIVVRETGKTPLEITGIEPYTPADRSELQEKDIILEIDSEAITDWQDYKEVSKRLRDAKNIVFYVKRGSRNLYAGVNNP